MNATPERDVNGMVAVNVFLNYVHLISVCVALGIFFFIRFVSTPFLRRLAPVDPNALPVLIKTGEALVPLAWIAFSVAAVNGAVIMVMSRHYPGFMVVPPDDPWATMMLTKHVIIAVMAALLVGFTLVVKTSARKLSEGRSVAAESRVMDILGALYFVLGIGVLVCAAITRYGYHWSLVVPHTLHTVVLACWIGGLFFVIFIGTPTIAGMVKAGKLTQYEAVHHLHLGASRFINVLWFAMFVSIFSGFFMLFVDSERYAGFLRNFDGANLVMVIKQVVFLFTILGAFVVTPAIARLGKGVEYGAKQNPIAKETMAAMLKDRAIIIQGAKYGFCWLQVMLVITAVLMTMRG